MDGLTPVGLTDVRFWCVALGVASLLAPLRRHPHRRWVFAAANLGFVAMALGHLALALLGGIAIFAGVLRLLSGGRHRALIVSLAVAGLGLFIVNKLPEVGQLAGVPLLHPLLRVVGFSYVILRMVEVLRAVQEGRHPAPGLADLLNYLMPFHMLAAGPIQAYDDHVAHGTRGDGLTLSAAMGAVDRIVLGLLKKFLLAGVLQDLFLTGFQSSGAYHIFEVQVYFLWIYLDFSAYSDIAIGIGRLIGVHTPENFDRPYLAADLGEFWRRWHMSLASFIMRNVYVPLQLSMLRQWGAQRQLHVASVAFTVSFLFCGMWHGLTWEWVGFGLLHGLGLTALNLRRAWLRQRHGARRASEMLRAPWRRAVGLVLTYEFVAFTVAWAF